jgi:hypothetical protein
MSLTATPSIVYRSQNNAAAVASGQPLRMFPLPPDCPIQFAAYAFEQQFEQSAASFPPAPKNTPSNSGAFAGLLDGSAILTALSNPTIKGGLNVGFSGRFNVVPASWDDFKMMAYTYPGFPGVIGGDSRNVGFPNGTFLVRVHYDYFVVDPGNIISSVVARTPGVATTLKDSGGASVNCVYQKADIPSIRKSIFVPLVSGVYDFNVPVLSLVPAGGLTVGSVSYLETLPTVTQYKAWISRATAAGWGATIWNGAAGSGSGQAGDANVGQFIAEDSSLSTYAGNIVSRATMYILAR